MVKANNLGRLSFIKVAADGIREFPMKLSLRVSFREYRSA